MTIIARRTSSRDAGGAGRLRDGERRHGHAGQRRYRRRLAPVRAALPEAIGEKLTEVPYEGTGPALTDLVGGQVDFMCDQTTNTTGQIQAGEIKAYAVTTPERVESLPDLPTTEEAGLEGMEVSVWHGLYVPAEVPDEIVQKLSDALQVALADQNVIDQLAELGSARPPRRTRRRRRTPSGSRSRSSSGDRSSRRPASRRTDSRRAGGGPAAPPLSSIREGS